MRLLLTTEGASLELLDDTPHPSASQHILGASYPSHSLAGFALSITSMVSRCCRQVAPLLRRLDSCLPAYPCSPFALSSHLSQSELHYTANTQLEALHSRYTGTIHPDVTKHEWLSHQHRDTLASIVGHPSLLSYNAIAEGECRARIKHEICQVSASS